jgi:integrase
MPKLTAGNVPKYRLHKARGLAVVRLSGVDHYLGPWKSKASLIAYDALIAEWLAHGRVLPRDGNEVERFTIVEIVAEYLAFAKKYYRREGRKESEYDTIVRAIRPLKALYGREAAATFGPLKLEVVRSEYVKAGNARVFANKQTSRIRRMFKWAVSKELVPPGVHQALCTLEPLKAGRCVARELEPITPVAESDVQAVLPHLSQTVADMIRLQRACGCRPAEICALRPGDLDRSGDVWLFRPHEHKTKWRGKERIIFIGPRGQEILQPYLLRAADAYCFSPIEAERERLADLHYRRKTPLSCGNRPGSNRKAKPKRTKGERYTVDSYRRAIHRAFLAPDRVKGAEREKWQAEHRWSPNRLRHAAASVVRKQFGEEFARIALGHSRIDTTRLYGERDLSKGVEVARLIG